MLATAELSSSGSVIEGSGSFQVELLEILRRDLSPLVLISILSGDILLIVFLRLSDFFFRYFILFCRLLVLAALYKVLLFVFISLGSLVLQVELKSAELRLGLG